MLGPEHSDMLTSMTNLAVTIMDQGRRREAVELMVECVQLRKRVLPADHSDILTSVTELAE